MFDTKTETFQEWPVLAGRINNDLVVRLNTKTGEAAEHLLARLTNIRRVNVDNRTNPPTFWVGNSRL